ncbi:MAG: murein biosynthesis integral membrane protein MurJ [Planctomycetota bacterium]|jgi:putative peptidoglycan lipid II flippase
MIKGFRQIALLTALSRVFGMLRDMAVSYFFGCSGLMDGWAIAFKIPNLARRLFGEGAAASSLVPVYSEQLHTDTEAAHRLASTVVTVIFTLLAAIVLIGEAGIWSYYAFFSKYPSTDLKLALAGIMLPYMILICTVAILAGILNAHRHFAAPAAAPIVLNLFIIGALCFTGWVLKIPRETQVFFVAAAVLIAGVVQILIQLPPLRAKGIHIRPAWEVRSDAFKKILVLMGPMILGLTVTQINTLADDFIALWLSGSPDKGQVFSLLGRQISYPLWEGAVSQLFYSQRLYQFPLGVLGISLATAVFPVMSAEAARRDFDALQKTIARGLRAAIFVALPATVGLILVAKPLVSALFEHGEFTSDDSAKVAWTLCFYALGLTGYFTQQIVTRAFYSTKDSRMPARSALAAVFVNIVLNLTLIWYMGTAGLALSTALCSYLQVLILLWALRNRFSGHVLDGLFVALLKTAAATAAMALVAIAVILMMQGLPETRFFSVIRLAAVVPCAAAAYILTARALRIEALSLLTGRSQPNK